MGRLALAWKVLTSGDFAARITGLLNAPPAIAAAPEPAPNPVTPPKPSRSDAISLLAALQREGRLIDFLKEPIESYSDAQVGAAVRDIHRDCGAVLERQFAIRAVLDQAEGSMVALTGKPPGRIRLTGKVDSNATSGTLIHHGWQATTCSVPVYTGDAESALVVAPAEVEVR